MMMKKKNGDFEGKYEYLRAPKLSRRVSKSRVAHDSRHHLAGVAATIALGDRRFGRPARLFSLDALGRFDSFYSHDPMYS